MSEIIEGSQDPLLLAVIVGSTRPGAVGGFDGVPRKGIEVGRWVHEHARRRPDARYTLVDLAEEGLPMFDEPLPPSMGAYVNDHTRAWAERIAGFDGFVFVTAEYNRSMPASLKNALDFVYAEWHDKAAGCVGYGALGGAHAVADLRGVLSELGVAHVQPQVALGLYTDFRDLVDFAPAEHQAEALQELLGKVESWARAMRTVRRGAG